MTTIEDDLRSLAATAAQAPDLDAVLGRGTRLRQRRRRTWLGGAAVAVAGVLIAVPVMTLGGAPASTSAASQFLSAVAQRAGAQPMVDPATVPYWYSKSRVTTGGDTYTRQVWLGHTRPGRLIQPDEPGPQPLDVAVFPAGSTGLSWDDLLTLPRDPDQLSAWLRQAVGDAGHDVDSEMFVAVGDLLRESPAPPTLRQALYQVAAGIPDVALAEGLTDAAGRPATAVSRQWPEGGGTQTYLIDVDTGALLQERDTNPDGTLAFQATYLQSGPVTTASAKP